MITLKIIYMMFIAIYANSVFKKCKNDVEKGIIFLLFVTAVNTIRV